MNNLEIKVQEIDSVLKCISEALSSLTEENFDTVMDNLNTKIKMYLTLKNNLKTEFPDSVVRDYESSRMELTKLIKQKFDNIINENKTEQELIKSELANFHNQKKLTNYNR